MFNVNPLLLTDVYKMGHMEQYPEGTTKIYSYLHSRSDKKYNEIVIYGLNRLIRHYLMQSIYKHQVEEFLEIREHLLGAKTPAHIKEKLYNLVKLGHFPLCIKSYDEGTVLPAKSVIATITNTHPEFYWTVGFFESLLLHSWYPITVASASRKYYKLVKKYGELTCDNLDHLPYAVHDFGYRGVTSEESAMIAGSAHLIHFKGTDTVPAIKYIKDNYIIKDTLIGCSVPASEHSVMCSFGRENEIKAFENMLDLYPTGIVSIVSDSYDLWNVLTVIASDLKEKILIRDGKVIFRPDSGIPLKILCGDFEAKDEREKKGVFNLLSEVFGYTYNSKGYKILNHKIGVIYGDGMTYDNFNEILATMEKQGWASSNLAIGVGGLLLQSHSRDDLGFSFKATYAEINGKPINIYKDPITDGNKKSMTGLIKVEKEGNSYRFLDKQTWEQEQQGELKIIYYDGCFKTSNEWKDILEKAFSYE